MADERTDDILTRLRIIFIGNSGVGKSCLIVRFTEDRFDENFPATIGLDYRKKVITVYDQNVDLQLQTGSSEGAVRVLVGKKFLLKDTAGADRFHSLTPSYYRGVQGIILVYDVTSRASFESLDAWWDEAMRYCDENDVVAMLVGNKIDKEGREVTRDEGLKYARRHGMLFIETSAKTRYRVQEAFEELVMKPMAYG